MAKEKIVEAYCGSCKRETNHSVLASYESSYSPDAGEDYWSQVYQVISCRGCNSVSFRDWFASIEDFDPNTGEPIPIISLYPDRTPGREPMKGHESFPDKTDAVYEEIVRSLNFKLNFLTSIGIRALIESLCIEQKAKGGNLKAKINSLVTQGLLSVQQAHILHGLRFMGNVAAHEIEASKPQELVAALDIAETLLKAVYILPKLEASIKTGKKVSAAVVPPPKKTK